MTDFVDLFSVIDPSLADDPKCFDSFLYHEWEREVAKPALEALGYTDVYFSDGERDSFGPLTRRATGFKDGKWVRMIYG